MNHYFQHSLDMATEKPDELIGSEGGSVGDALVVIFGLTCLGVLEVRPKFVVDMGERLLEIGGGRDVDGIGEARLEREVETEVGVEWRDFGRFVRMIVVGEFGEGKEVDPVVLIVRNEGAEISLQRLVRTLSQTVGLGMIGRRVFDGDLKMAGEFGPEARDEGRATVGDDGVRETVVTEDTVEEEPGETGSVRRFSGGNEMSIADETIAHAEGPRWCCSCATWEV